MAEDRAFVYVACGAAIHVHTLRRSLEYLRPRTSYPIVVVTDSRRNEIAIDHDTVIDVETPPDFDHHQASIFLKTSLHRCLPSNREHVYLDTDVLAVNDGVDTIFDHRHGPVTFAHDLTHLDSRVGTFSPWAVRCPCPQDQGLACGHLTEAIEAKFNIQVPDDWMHWNGGVFLFGRDGAPFMDTWHRLTMEVFKDPYWKTRDQGTLIATVWELGLQRQNCLPPHFDFIVDDNNTDLCFDRTTGYSLHESIPGIHPSFLHLYHADLDRPGWSLARDLEDVLEERTRARARQVESDGQWRTRSTIGARLAPRPLARRAIVPPGDPRSITPPVSHPKISRPLSSSHPRYEVIVGLPLWSTGGDTVVAATLLRALVKRGGRAHALLTGHHGGRGGPEDPVQPEVSGVPVIDLPVAKEASWGTRWGTLVRHLEERAPCIYVPLGDWRHSNVSSRLSDRIGIVGMVRGENPLHLDEVDRLARYWNAIVCPSAALVALVAERHPELTDRISQISPGAGIPDPRSGEEAPSGGPLRVVYHGRLVHQAKRVLDLPRIVDGLIARGVPVELTVIGDGPDRAGLLAHSSHLLAQGAMRYLGPLSHERTLEELRGQHACLLTSEIEGVPLAVIEAMASGCVPVVSATSGGISELVVDAVNGYLTPVGDIDGFCRRLEGLNRDPTRRLELAKVARQTVIDRFGAEDMIDAYLSLFDRIGQEVADGVYRRPRGLLRKPPYQVADQEVFPVHYFRGVSGIGVFPSYHEDYDDYRAAVGERLAQDLPRWRPALVHAFPVIMAGNTAPDTSADRTVAALAQGLRRVDQPGYVQVASGARSAIESIRFGDGVPVTNVRAARFGRPRWRAMVRELRKLSPCLYLPGDDWLHWCISPHLPQEVAVIGRVDLLTQSSLDRVRRMSPYWNAVVAGSAMIADRLVALDPALSTRIVTIPRVVPVPNRLAERPLIWGAPLRMSAPHPVPGALLGALAAADVPVELTAAVDPDSAAHEGCEVFVVLADTERYRMSVLNAMGRGCVPVVARGDGTIADLIQDGENGYLLPDREPVEFVGRLKTLQHNAALRRGLAVRAFQTVDGGAYRADDVFASYMMLFERVLRDIEFGTYRRPVADPRSLERTWREIAFGALGAYLSRLRRPQA